MMGAEKETVNALEDASPAQSTYASSRVRRSAVRFVLRALLFKGQPSYLAFGRVASWAHRLLGREYSVETSRSDAAAATWIFRGIRVAATPRQAEQAFSALS